jgi:hypothetical protein
LNNIGELQLINPAGEHLFTDVQTKLVPALINKGYDGLTEIVTKALTTGILEKGDPMARSTNLFDIGSAHRRRRSGSCLHDVSHLWL